MPDPVSPSRRQLIRMGKMGERLVSLEALLDALPDRRQDLLPGVAARARRTLREARDLLGLPVSSRLETARRPADFVVELMVVYDAAARARALSAQAAADLSTGRSRPLPAPW